MTEPSRKPYVHAEVDEDVKRAIAQIVKRARSQGIKGEAAVVRALIVKGLFFNDTATTETTRVRNVLGLPSNWKPVSSINPPKRKPSSKRRPTRR